MDKKRLKNLFQQLTVDEKIAQTVQLNGSLIAEYDVMNTGPMENLGLPEDLNIYEVGSIYNVNDFQKLKELQEKALESSRLKIPMLFM